MPFQFPILAVLVCVCVLLLLPHSCIADGLSDSAVFNNGYDHRAHAKTGGPYVVEDSRGVGYAIVTVDAQSSHSHYFNALTGATGKITAYVWYLLHRKNETEEWQRSVLCRRMTCAARFPHGVTRLRLTVTDNTGDTSTAFTTITVVDGAKPGVRVWFYRNEPWVPFSIDDRDIPSLSTTRPRLDYSSFASFPPALKLGSSPCSIRVIGYINIPTSGEYRFQLSCGGAACSLKVDNRPVIDGEFGLLQSEKPFWFKQGTYSLLVLFRRRYPKSKRPSLALKWRKPGDAKFGLVPPAAFSHRPALIRPIVHAVKPERVRVGGVLVVKGTSFIDVKAVRVGKLACDGVISPSEFSLKCVVPGVSGKVRLSVITGTGRSNFLTLEVTGHVKGSNSIATTHTRPPRRGRDGATDDDGDKKSNNIDGKKKNTKEKQKDDSQGSKNKNGGKTTGPVGYYQPVRFRKTFLKRNGTVWKMPQLTSITLGPDGRYYIGSLGGYVHAVTTDLFGTAVESHCRSEHVGTHRSILGLAFNPAQPRTFALYASTSVLYWRSKRYLLSVDGWANGEVITMKKHKQRCLVKSKTVLSGLPISNYDHSVNALAFDNRGRLLVSIGCTTNAGVSRRDDGLGGVPDSPLSGSFVVADVLRKGFNGHVKYNQYKNPGTANIVSGDVELFAVGIRNSFGAVMHSNGELYATDNGANPKYGVESAGCRPWQTAKPAHEKDTLKRVAHGKWYGFPNRNRGRFDKAQCIHVRPTLTNETRFYRRKYPAFTESEGWERFQPALVKLDASTNGIVEYTANTFGAQLRGDLFATKFAVHAGGLTVRIKLDHDDPDKVRAVVPVAQHSGLGVAMTGTGALLMPRVYQGVVAALVPREWDPKRVVVTSVLPVRGPAGGGNDVTVTGWNLWKGVTVRFGARVCRRVRDVSPDGRSLRCTAPGGDRGAKVPVVAYASTKRRSSSYGFEYMYMNV